MSNNHPVLRMIKKIFLVFTVVFTVTTLTFVGWNFKSIRNMAITAGIIKSMYIDQVKISDLLEGAPGGMVDSLGDKYSEYVTAKEYKEVLENLQGGFAGIGVYITEDPAGILVLYAFPDSPALKAGLEKGDIIYAINGKDVESMDLDTASALLKGKEGSEVSVSVKKATTGKNAELKITRQFIEPSTVYGRLLKSNPDIAYVYITQFNQKTPEQLDKLLQKLGSFSSIILDLRNNPGGEVSGALDVASFFIPQGPIMYEETRYSIKTYDAKGNNIGAPLVVLVNGNTASAAEIVSGAIQDTKSGVLVGAQTFGKGIVQSFIPTGTGDYVKLTTARYLTPKKRSIHGKGLTPDIVMEEDSIESELPFYDLTFPDETNPLIQKAIEVIRSK